MATRFMMILSDKNGRLIRTSPKKTANWRVLRWMRQQPEYLGYEVKRINEITWVLPNYVFRQVTFDD